MSEERVVDQALELFHEAGVEGEIFLERSMHTTITVCEGKIETLVQRNSRGAGVRVFEDGRVAMSFTPDLDRNGLAGAIASARGVGPHTKQDEANGLPSIAASLPALVNADPAVLATPLAKKADIARQVELAAKAESPRIERVREASYQDFHGRIWIAGTSGGRISHEASRCFAGIELAASDSRGSQTGSKVAWALGPDGLDAHEVGRGAARRALGKLGARQPATHRGTVVLDPEATAGLIGALAGLFSAEASLMERSLFSGRIGEEVAAPGVTLVDDGRIAGGCDSAPVDGEGTPTSETILIENGRLAGFFHTVFTSRKMGVPPTGNGVRGNFSFAPEPSPTNLYLRPTGIARQELLASVSSGIYVTEWLGLHTVNTTTGDFSLGAVGASLKNGTIGEAIDRMAVAGNIIDLLRAVEAVADDLTFLVHGGGATVLLRDISISGAGGA